MQKSSAIQSVIFDKSMFDTKQAKRELQKYGLIPIKEVHITKNKLRYRIENPENFKVFRTKKTVKGIEFVIGYT